MVCHLECAVAEGPHHIDPGFRGGVDEATINPGGDLVFLKDKDIISIQQ